MIATVYFWSEYTGTLKFDGVEYEANARDAYETIHFALHDDSERRMVSRSASPSIRALLNPATVSAEQRAAMSRLVGQEGRAGLLWRTGVYKMIPDVIPVLVSHVDKTKYVAHFRSVGPFLAAKVS